MQKNSIIKSPAISIIGINKFKLIWKYFHYNDNYVEIKGPTYKVDDRITYCRNKWMSIYQPSQSLFIDEAMIKFTGRT